MNRLILNVAILIIIAPVLRADETVNILTRGTMAKACDELEKLLAQEPDDQTRFALGIAQTLRGVENLAAAMYRHGLRSDTWARSMPFFRIPVPQNPQPQPVSYDDARSIGQQWLEDMSIARKTLSQIENPADVKLHLPIGLVHVDLNGDGKADQDERLWRVFAAVNPGAGVNEQNAQEFVIGLDGGDVHWLIGYTHLLSALQDMALAYDARELFEATGHMFFAQVKTPHEYLNRAKPVADFGMGVDIVDAVAFIHLLNLPVKEPQRMKSAHQHLQAMINQSRKSWELILAETDDDHEWIPNPKQTTVLPRLRVTDEIVKGWMTFLDEGEAVLSGKKLIPFWRTRDGRGVNLQRVFMEPTRFDLVLWIQGTAATPYLEQGELTTPETWQTMQRMFQGDFFTFALWFN